MLVFVLRRRPVVILCCSVITGEIKRWWSGDRVCARGLDRGVKGSGSSSGGSGAPLSTRLAERKCSLLISYQMIPIGPDR